MHKTDVYAYILVSGFCNSIKTVKGHKLTILRNVITFIARYIIFIMVINPHSRNFGIYKIPNINVLRLCIMITGRDDIKYLMSINIEFAISNN